MASGGLTADNMATTVDWKFYKATVPYHGEIFISPETGIVVRLITQADFKSSDLVRQDDERIDYAPALVGDKTLVVPVRTVINAEDIPSGDAGAGSFDLRHTMFSAEYKDFHAGS